MFDSYYLIWLELSRKAKKKAGNRISDSGNELPQCIFCWFNCPTEHWLFFWWPLGEQVHGSIAQVPLAVCCCCWDGGPASLVTFQFTASQCLMLKQVRNGLHWCYTDTSTHTHMFVANQIIAFLDSQSNFHLSCSFFFYKQNQILIFQYQISLEN